MVSVVVGPPCAGKSTYVNAKAATGDVIICFDRLALALGNNREHMALANIADVAVEARKAAIKRLLERGYDGWIIHAAPNLSQIGYYKANGARFVLLDPGIDECLRRCQADRREEGTEDLIKQWYDRPPRLV